MVTNGGFINPLVKDQTGAFLALRFYKIWIPGTPAFQSLWVFPYFRKPAIRICQAWLYHQEIPQLLIHLRRNNYPIS